MPISRALRTAAPLLRRALRAAACAGGGGTGGPAASASCAPYADYQGHRLMHDADLAMYARRPAGRAAWCTLT